MVVEPDRELPGLDCVGSFAAAEGIAIAQRIGRELAAPDAFTPLALEGLALELLALAGRLPSVRPRRPAPPWLNQVRELVHESFRERPATGALAAVVGVHPTHLARVFRAYHGVTLGEYARRIRIEWAAHELARADRSIARIAADGGIRRPEPLHACVQARDRPDAGAVPQPAPLRAFKRPLLRFKTRGRPPPTFGPPATEGGRMSKSIRAILAACDDRCGAHRRHWGQRRREHRRVCERSEPLHPARRVRAADARAEVVHVRGEARERRLGRRALQLPRRGGRRPVRCLGPDHVPRRPRQPRLARRRGRGQQRPHLRRSGELVPGARQRRGSERRLPT